jgi:hypothetical protein
VDHFLATSYKRRLPHSFRTHASSTALSLLGTPSLSSTPRRLRIRRDKRKRSAGGGRIEAARAEREREKEKIYDVIVVMGRWE